MSTKTCPSCGADVPSFATVCKHCFHNFTAVAPRKTNPVVILLGFMVAGAVIGAAVFAHVYYNHAAERIVVDAETKSIVITRTTAAKTSTNRVDFAEVSRVEYVMGGDSAAFEVVAITSEGERIVIQADEQPLFGEAEKYAQVMGNKPLDEVKNVKGFTD